MCKFIGGEGIMNKKSGKEYDQIISPFWEIDKILHYNYY